ncbi:hypothetical protein [Caballeronia zhejiangensis]|uniref:hypothetical protein n=1 Tax=Caballeronia zhejiangensis TaxID=871203 RepID=UPI001FD55E3F|nr:hypothetical protein [Caballeronia zhejiangensis]
MDENPVDAAALLGAALAVVLAVLIAEGPFDYMNGVVSITVLAIIYAYQWERPRPQRKLSLALSCTIAIVATLLVGVAGEIVTSGLSLKGHLECTTTADTPPLSKCVQASNLPFWIPPTSWVVITLVVYAIDRHKQRRKSSPTG